MFRWHGVSAVDPCSTARPRSIDQTSEGCNQAPATRVASASSSCGLFCSLFGASILMDLQTFLVDKFTRWSPPEPKVLKRTKCSITLDWHNVEPFDFIRDQLLYRLEKNEKIPPWVVVYRGGKTSKEIDNLASRHCHKFRLRAAVYDSMRGIGDSDDSSGTSSGEGGGPHTGAARSDDNVEFNLCSCLTRRESVMEIGNNKYLHALRLILRLMCICPWFRSAAVPVAGQKWLASQWSALTWSSTDTDGTSAVCFCMAVQGMLDERPALIGIINSKNGFTPLATAVRKGDINTVRFLLSAGAEIEQRSATGQSALHIAVLNANIPIVQLLLEQGADFEGRDLNDLRVEHYAVDSCSLEMLRYILDRGGDVHVEDSNGWTPLFRALCQNAATEVIEELVVRGSSLELADRAGLPLTSAARLLRDRQGRGRDSVLRLVDTSYPHEKALANFTRLTKKIYNVHSLLKLPSPRNKN
ncbi:hypothetical protein HW555_007120 [Spodoptera exigua]|uniref:Uncharacterized protein n=1 Tax=Spodoptera exigua TaxID=7107 RepID=A0A835L4P9_SPOEX|nr:hypothetical protein HW555_007120 [Spodoptera exigua]